MNGQPLNIHHSHETNGQAHASADHSRGDGHDHEHDNVQGHLRLRDQQVFGAVWEANREALYWLAFRILDNRQEAQDVVTEAFVKLYHSTQIFSSEGSVKGWLRVTVRNGALKVLEQNDRHKNKLSEFSALLHDVEAQWYQEDVLAGVLSLLYEEIEALPPKSREVFKLRYIEQLSNEDIAARLGIGYQSVRNHLVRALKALRLSMGQYSHLLGVMLLFLRNRD